MKAVVAAFKQEKALVGAFSVITNLWMELLEALVLSVAACGIFCKESERQCRQQLAAITPGGVASQSQCVCCKI